jgi:hypothetical protein
MPENKPGIYLVTIRLGQSGRLLTGGLDYSIAPNTSSSGTVAKLVA